MLRRLLLLSALTAVATPVAAQVETVSTGADRTAVVIYRDQPVDTSALMAQSNQPWSRLDRQGLALIVETRTLDLPAGEAVIRLRGVATGIVPQTATLDGLPAHVVERNTDFDLLSPGSLLNKSVGEVVRVVRTNPATGERVEKAAVVRSGASGPVLEVDGKLEALNCSGLTERIVFDRVPEGLSDQPTLSIRTRAETAGRHTVTLAYLATGLQWSADYVARMAPDGQTLDLTGWITLANFGGTGFRDAPVQVVAGRLNRDEGTVPVDPVEVTVAPQCWPMDTTTHGEMPVAKEDRVFDMAPPPPPSPSSPAMQEMAGALNDIVVTGSRIARQSELGDYKVYTLPEATDVLARQTKQVRFLEQEGVRFTRIYQSRLDSSNTTDGEAPQLLLRLRNEERDGLGVALPGGGVSVMETSGGRSILGGQARFEDRGVGLPVELPFGDAMGITVSQTSEPQADRRRDWERYAVEVTVSNDKTEAVEVELVPNEAGERGFRIVSSSARSVITDAGLPAWRLRVPAGRTEILRYTVEYGG